MDTRSNSVRELDVGRDGAGQRLDNFLIRELGGVPRSLVYRLIRTGQVRVNGGRAKPMRKLAAEDRVRIPPLRVADSVPVRVPEARVEEVRARILHRQSEFIVIDKPAGMASQAGSGLSWGLNDLMLRIDPRALPVHRLDRETSGVMVFALGVEAARALQQAFRRTVAAGGADKRYLALLDGQLSEDRVDVDQPLLKIRDAGGQHRVIVDPAGQPARTSFRRLERLSGRDFVEVRIETGRTHQIRAHARWLGCPLVGDARYNPNPAPSEVGRLFLHAASLRLPWPEDQIFSAALPDELARALEVLRRPALRSRGVRST